MQRIRLLSFGRRAALAALAVMSTALLAAAPSTASATPSLAVAELGLPDSVGYAVNDASAVRKQLAAATGNQFTPLTTSIAPVVLPQSGDLKLIKLTETHTVRGGPFLEIVQASSKIGPWAADAGHSSFFLSYAVDSVPLSGIGLHRAGLELLASNPGKFAFWRGKGGVLIRLIDKRLAPQSGVSQPQAPLDLGPVTVPTIVPCDPAGVLTQLSAALPGIDWRAPALYPLPFEFSDGTSRLIEENVNATVQGPPLLTIESPAITLPEYNCTATTPHVHIVWLVADVPAAAAQVEAAGMPWMSRVPGLVSLHRGTGGIFVEIADGGFLSGA
jgi:hypothetical protein